MVKERICKKCSQSIDAKAELYSICEGECSGYFHAACVGLSEGDLDTISLKMNIIWMCDVCMDKFRSISDGTWTGSTEDMTKTKSIDEEVKQLKIAVSEIMDTLAKIVPSVDPHDRRLLHSTPVSTDVLDGIEACRTCETIESNEGHRQQSQFTTDVDNLSLFISNIDSSASECDVRRMISRALDTPETERIAVTKLVSKWNHLHPPDFVSFKVTVDKKWKSHALNPLIWPKNVRFREFVVRHNVTWRPEQ